MPLTVGIIGYGEHGHFLLEACRRMSGIRVRSIYRRSMEAAQEAASKYGVIAARSYQELLADPQIQAVFITSPSQVHREHLVASLEAGKHVLIEKPLADSLEDAKAIVAAVKKTDRVVMVDHCERFDPAFLDAKQVVASGRIGELRAISCSRLSPLHLNNPAWKMGVLDTAVHNFDLICWYMDAVPTQICARSARVNQNLKIDDHAWISLQFEGGRHAEDHIAWLAMDNYLMPVAHPRFLLHGTKGFYQVDLTRRSGLLYDGQCSRYTDDVLLGLSEEYLATMAYTVWHFMRAVERGGPSPMPASAALLASRLAMAAGESIAAGGKWIAIPRDD
jgi:UDP-N-acetylglucosamine 3-dehydrogenase